MKYDALTGKTYTWLVTGAAGFIGSHLVEKLLKLNQNVVGVDSFITGTNKNLREVKESVGSKWSNFRMIEGNLCAYSVAENAMRGCDYILHQAALGSVPRSIAQPIITNRNNVDSFVNVLTAAKDSKTLKRIIWASSSSVYGNMPSPNIEHALGFPMSPYTASKVACEAYAQAFSECYDIFIIGLRYFNVFGPRQLYGSAHSAVIPQWAKHMTDDLCKGVHAFGDPDKIYRDFTYIDNVVHANILAALWDGCVGEGSLEVNVGTGRATSLRNLHDKLLQYITVKKWRGMVYAESRAGDKSVSRADISLAETMGYTPIVDFDTGLKKTLKYWGLRR